MLGERNLEQLAIKMSQAQRDSMWRCCKNWSEGSKSNAI
jgi:hypothetical protein